MRWLAWLVCLSGCQLVFSLDSTPGDAPDAPDGGPVAGACPTRAASLVDPMRDALKPGWQILRSAEDQALTATPKPTGLELALGVQGRIDVYSLFSYDLVNSRFAIQLETDGTPTTMQNRVQFGLLAPAVANGDAPGQVPAVEWTLAENKLGATFSTGTSTGSLGVALPYSRAEHRYLAFSIVDGMMRWETSADGISFVTRFEEPIRFQRARPFMQSRRAESAAAPLVTFSDLNATMTEAEACPASELRTTFDHDDPLEWQHLFDAGCAIEVGGGVARLSSTTDIGFTCEYASTGVFQLIGSSFDVALPAQDLPDNADELYVDVESVALARITLQLRRTSGLLKVGGFALPAPGKPLETIFNEDEAGERYFRFAGSTDLMGKHKVTVSTSTDGVTFVRRGDFSGLEGFEKARVVLGGITHVPTTAITFDGVGAPP